MDSWGLCSRSPHNCLPFLRVSSYLDAMKFQQQDSCVASMLIGDRQGSSWVCALVPDIPGCPVTCGRGPAPQSPPVIISNKTLFILQSARIVGRTGPRAGAVETGRTGSLLSLGGPSGSSGSRRQGMGLTFWLLHLDHMDV